MITINDHKFINYLRFRTQNILKVKISLLISIFFKIVVLIIPELIYITIIITSSMYYSLIKMYM